MRSITRALAAASLLLACGASARADGPAPGIAIAHEAARTPADGPTATFVGAVRVDPMLAQHSPASRVTVGSVTFAPGARSNWHTHPAGQTLVVTAGLGWIQQEGGPVREIGPGDVVWIPPGIRHWHGASPSEAMTHIAIQEVVDGRAVDWLEPVGDDQYHK